MYIRMNDNADPKGQSFADLNCLSMMLPIICESAPPSKSGIMNEPKQGINTRMIPDVIPGLMLGIITLKKVLI